MGCMLGMALPQIFDMPKKFSQITFSVGPYPYTLPSVFPPGQHVGSLHHDQQQAALV